MKNFIHEIKLKNLNIKNNVFLAPMAGVTDIPFRKVCRNFNPGLTYTEMASSKAMEFESSKTERLLEVMEDEGLQQFKYLVVVLRLYQIQ